MLSRAETKHLKKFDLIFEANAVVFITETWFQPTGDEVKIKELTPPQFLFFTPILSR